MSTKTRLKRLEELIEATGELAAPTISEARAKLLAMLEDRKNGAPQDPPEPVPLSEVKAKLISRIKKRW